MIENALILAAGKGTRMWPLTENSPKPLLPLGGLPIIERQIQEFKKVGVKNLYILIGYQMKELSDYLDETIFDININYIVQEMQNGTGHAVNQAKGIIQGNFYCINGDLIVDSKNLERLKEKKNNLTMMVTRVKDGANFGVVDSMNGRLVSIKEKSIRGESSINAGIFLFNERIFEAIDNIEKSIRGEFELTDALQNISNEIHILEYQGFWKDIGAPWDLITANKEYMRNLENQIKGNIEDNVVIKGNIHLEEGSIIKSGTYIEGPVWITFDVDGLDGSLVPSTGTPVPGGIAYWAAVEIVERVFSAPKSVVIGADVNEIAPGDEGPFTEFNAALIASKMVSCHIALLLSGKGE